MPDLHRRAAQWYQRNGWVAEAVRHAAESGDWQLAAGIVCDELAISQLIEPRGHHSLAEGFRRIPLGLAWTQPEPLLVIAALELSGAAASTTLPRSPPRKTCWRAFPPMTASRPGWPPR